jgi:hypothetical protein
LEFRVTGGRRSLTMGQPWNELLEAGFGQNCLNAAKPSPISRTNIPIYWLVRARRAIALVVICAASGLAGIRLCNIAGAINEKRMQPIAPSNMHLPGESFFIVEAVSLTIFSEGLLLFLLYAILASNVGIQGDQWQAKPDTGSALE